MSHIAGRSMVDSRPFQIFEGSNDILYQQITESVLKKMKRAKQTNLYEFLKDYSLTEYAAEHFKESTNFDVNYKMAQRNLVKLGRALGRIVTMNMTIQLGQSGFNSDMVSNSIKSLKGEINGLISAYSSNESPDIIDNYEDSSSWLDLVKA